MTKKCRLRPYPALYMQFSRCALFKKAMPTIYILTWDILTKFNLYFWLVNMIKKCLPKVGIKLLKFVRTSCQNINKRIGIKGHNIVITNKYLNKMNIVSFIIYHIAQNSGRGKLWRIWQIECHSPIFYLTKFISIFVKLSTSR